jgi:hypothetical protein
LRFILTKVVVAFSPQKVVHQKTKNKKQKTKNMQLNLFEPTN